MIKTVDKPCPGDCSKCPYPSEIQGFDMYGCALNQTLQRSIRLEKSVHELYGKLKEMEENTERVIINHLEETLYETSDETLPEPGGKK